MRKFLPNYLSNFFRLQRADSLLKPLVVTYYLTTKCNLNCRYCEDFGARRNADAIMPSSEQARRILAAIRAGSERLVLTGGEPLLHPQVDSLIRYAKSELDFKHIAIISNGSLIAEHQAALPYLDQIIISLDSLNLDLWHQIIDAPRQTAETILYNITTLAGQQRQHNFHLTLNCVLTPDTLDGVPALIEFCQQHDLTISFSPQAVHNWPSYDLLVTPQYNQLLDELVSLKKQGAPILGSVSYFQTMQALIPYKCYPTLAPRVMPNGDLVYPCRPIEKEQDSHGGRTNLLDHPNWQSALQNLADEYGPPPRACTSCFQQCFAEPSLMQAQPLALMKEKLRYRKASAIPISTFTPG